MLDSDGRTPLPYWIDWSLGTHRTNITTKIASLGVNATKTIHLAYDQPSATTTADERAVFDLFDDFADNTMDTGLYQQSTWGNETGVTATETGGELRVTGQVRASDYSPRGYYFGASRTWKANWNEVRVDVRYPVGTAGLNRASFRVHGDSNKSALLMLYPASASAPGYSLSTYDSGVWSPFTTVPLLGNEGSTFHTLRVRYNKYVLAGSLDLRFDNYRRRNYGAVAPVASVGAEQPVPPVVLFGGVASTSVVVESAMRLTAVAPPGTEAGADIVVTNPDGQTATAAGAWDWQ